MQKFILFIYVSLVFILPVFTQSDTILKDDFSSIDKFTDLSELLLWGGNAEPLSVWDTTFKTDMNGVAYNALTLIPQAIGQGGYSSGSAYTSTCIDYLFEPIDRSQKALKLEFDYMSEKLSGSGESGRLGIAMLYDYPDAPPQFNEIYNVDDIAPFGRPAYNLRLLNGTGASKQAYLFYGGGKDMDGEFEKTGDGVWLPGFISGPGGTSPGSESDFPVGPVRIVNANVVSDTTWMHYTWLLFYERMMVFRRLSGAEQSENELLTTMFIPSTLKTDQEKLDFINANHHSDILTLPTLYNWFEHIEGVRFYYRSVQNGFLANIVLTGISDTTLNVNSIPETFSENNPQVIIFPNPVEEFLVIETPGNTGLVAEIIDYAGKTVKSYVLFDSTTLVDVRDLKQGIYMVVIKGNHSVYTKTIIKTAY